MIDDSMKGARRFAPQVEETLRAEDGTGLHYYEWKHRSGTGENDASVDAAVLLLHGYGEHLGRYGRWASAFAAHRMRLGGVDHRGMGLSGGRRAFVKDFSDYVNDASVAEARLMRDLPENTPLFVYGHSMGGLVALMYAEHCASTRARGAIISAPLLGLSMPVPAWRVAVGRRLVRLLPRLRNPVALEPAKLMRDPEEQALLASDPLALKFTTLSWFFSCERAMLLARRDISNVTCSTLWLLPGGDLICDAGATAAVFKMLPDKADHTLREYAGYYHEIHNELPAERDRVFDDALGWIRERSVVQGGRRETS
jgi:alpha-beta hydrolase superfamily lysophospholipase